MKTTIIITLTALVFFLPTIIHADIDGKIELSVFPSDETDLSNYTIIAYIDSINKTDKGFSTDKFNSIHIEQLITTGLNTININKEGLYKIGIKITDKNTKASYYKPVAKVVRLTPTNPVISKEITIKPIVLLDVSLILFNKNGNKINDGTVSLKAPKNIEHKQGTYAENLIVENELLETASQPITNNKFKVIKEGKYIISVGNMEKEIMFLHGGTVNIKL